MILPVLIIALIYVLGALGMFHALKWAIEQMMNAPEDESGHWLKAYDGVLMHNACTLFAVLWPATIPYAIIVAIAEKRRGNL